MSILKRGQKCVIVAGCPENIGLIVEVVRRIGKQSDSDDAYLIHTLSGRRFKQIWSGKNLVPGPTNEAITDRHKLRPLVEPKDKVDVADRAAPSPAVNVEGVTA